VISETSKLILEKVAPVFNKQGYVGTSLADITKATRLTKGAIYCNFSNKEELALQAFELNVKIAIWPLFHQIASKSNSIEKLYAITNYHRSYYDLVSGRGGCPMIRAGVDTKFINPKLFNRVQRLSGKMLAGLINIIEDGVSNNEISRNTDAKKYAKLILSMMEGSSFLAFTHNDRTYIDDAMDFIDSSIIQKIKN